MARQGPRPRAENPAPPLPPSSHSVDLAQPIHPTYDTRPVMSASPGIDSTATATLLARGICRALDQLGYASLVEFPLINGRRADILGIGKAGDLLIVEIKSSVADFRADRKWARYRDFADRLYFAVPNHFPQLLIPEECGLMVADPFGAALLRGYIDVSIPRRLGSTGCDAAGRGSARRLGATSAQQQVERTRAPVPRLRWRDREDFSPQSRFFEPARNGALEHPRPAWTETPGGDDEHAAAPGF